MRPLFLSTGTALAGASAALAAPVSPSSHTAFAPDASCTSWSGINSYYAWSLNSTFTEMYLDAMTAASVQVVRLFVVTTEMGKCTGQDWCTQVGDVEDPVGTYDDTILESMDDFLYQAYEAGVKVTLALHDRWALGCWEVDSYVCPSQHPSQPGCVVPVTDNVYPNCYTEAGDNNITAFYTDPTDQARSHLLAASLQH